MMKPTISLGWSVWALLLAVHQVAPLHGVQSATSRPARPRPEQVAASAAARNGTNARGLSLESLLGKLKMPAQPKKKIVQLGEDLASTTKLATRLGFDFELHHSVSSDGYTTQLVRLINPHIDHSLRRKVPVVLYAGQGTSPAAFLVGSLRASANESHSAHNWHPGSYPEHDEAHLVGDVHEQVASSRANRSLAVMLSNSGFDVWLVPARGVDGQNRARNLTLTGDRTCCSETETYDAKDETISSGSGSENYHTNKAKVSLSKRSLDGKEPNLVKKLEDAKKLLVDIKEKNKPKFQEEKLPELGSIDLGELKNDLLEKLRELLKSFASKRYWSFSNDEIIDKEFGCQLNVVRSVSGSKRVSLVTYSNGGFISFGFMSRYPAWARQHLDVVVALAPAVFVNKFHVALNLAGLASQVSLFDAPFPEDQLGALGKKLCLQEPMRSGACKALIEHIYGPSDSFNAGHHSASELNYALEHYLLRAQSAQALRQVLQVAHSGRMQQYDLGLLGNLVTYKQGKPPSYQLDQVYHERLYVVSGEQDAFVDQDSLVLLMGSIGCRPEGWLRRQRYNHLDLLLGRDVDHEVNLPVASILLDRDTEVDYYRESDGRAGGAVAEEVETPGDKDTHQETPEFHQTETHRGEQPGEGGEHENGQHNSEDQHKYEGHTTDHREGKSYDVEGAESDDPQVEQSALKPVRVASATQARNSSHACNSTASTASIASTASTASAASTPTPTPQPTTNATLLRVQPRGNPTPN